MSEFSLDWETSESPQELNPVKTLPEDVEYGRITLFKHCKSKVGQF